jgi:hypothetical protein
MTTAGVEILVGEEWAVLPCRRAYRRGDRVKHIYWLM